MTTKLFLKKNLAQAGENNMKREKRQTKLLPGVCLLKFYVAVRVVLGTLVQLQLTTDFSCPLSFF